MVTLPGKTQSGTEKTSLSLIYPWMTTVFTKRRRDATVHETYTHATKALYHTSISWLNFSTPSSVCYIHVLYFMLLFFFLIFLLLHLSLIDLEPFCHNHSASAGEKPLTYNENHDFQSRTWKNDTNEHLRKNSITQKNDSRFSSFLKRGKMLEVFIVFIFISLTAHCNYLQVCFNIGQQLNESQWNISPLFISLHFLSFHQ